MIISHRHRYIFVRTKKTASTSMELALSRTTGPEDVVPLEIVGDRELDRRPGEAAGRNSQIPRRAWGAREWARWAVGKPDIHFHNHMPAAQVKRYVGAKLWNEYFTFAFDRNPWDLTVSAFCWRNARHPDEWTSFDAFVASARLQKYSNWQRYSIGHEVAVDRLFRYDALEAATSEIAERLNLEPLAPSRARSHYRTDKRPYQSWYNDETRSRVADVFRSEIDHFGWTFD